VNNSISAGTPASAISTSLADWHAAIEHALQVADGNRVGALAQVVLRRLPRHLATYQQLLHTTWLLRRWDEGEDWGRRLLRADPGNALAWRALAMAAEQRGQRGRANATWQRAFEGHPYEPEIRAGLSRTMLRATHENDDGLTLNLACLARLYIRGYRWERAAVLYRQLVEADPRRIDFRLGLLASLWQLKARQEAYILARQLVQSQPYLLIAWAAIDALGDENDKALARNPIMTMDPGGEFVRSWFGLPQESRQVALFVSAKEAELLGSGTDK
jgi:tetratricopeptide (TPR) repeat protein